MAGVNGPGGLTPAQRRDLEATLLDDLDLLVQEEDERFDQPTEAQLDEYERATSGE